MTRRSVVVTMDLRCCVGCVDFRLLGSASEEQRKLIQRAFANAGVEEEVSCSLFCFAFVSMFFCSMKVNNLGTLLRQLGDTPPATW